MKWLAILSSVVLFAAPASADLEIQPIVPLSAKGLTVHEWGVFRVNDDAQYANAELRAEWDDLPPFIYGHIKGRIVPQHWGSLEIRRRPIIFFHAKEPAVVRVKVEFPGGLAGVWYPATERPAVYGQQQQPKASDALEWLLGIKQCPNGWQPKQPAPPAVGDKHWFGRIRQVKCDEVFSKYSPNQMDVERERFLYYDGIFPQGKWLKIAVEEDRVSLKSQIKQPVFDVTVVDRRGDKVRIGRINKLDAGESVKEIKFTDVDASRFASEAAETLLKQLVGAGLFEDEAKSLVDLWQKEFFETPGLNLFYRLPPEEYNARLPLTISPKPDAVVRVGLVFHGHLEPDFADRILELVKQLDADTFAQRDAAMKKLLAIGPAALVQLQRLQQKKNLSIEVKERIDALVKKWNARDGFDVDEVPPKH